MKSVNFVLLIAAFSIVQACNSGDDSVDKAKEANKEKDSSVTKSYNDEPTETQAILPVDKDAANFAVDVANGGMMEVELGKYAQQNAASQRIKDFGAMMEKDHTKANEELQKIASSKNITLPTSMADDTRKDMEGLMKKTGKDFDKAYMNMMLDDHKKNVKKFEDIAQSSKDSAIRSFAGKTLPVLLVHLDSAKAITGKN